MPALTDAAAQARLLARRGADAAAVVLGASFHPFRTVRDGAHLVQGLMNPPEQVKPTPPATDLATEKATDTLTEPVADKPAAKKAAAKKPTAKKAATKKAAPKPVPGPETVAKEPAPPVADPDIPAVAEDLAVDPSGPAPHIPPRIAGEVERDYGDELPGIKDWKD